jgi:hypothetical protein
MELIMNILNTRRLLACALCGGISGNAVAEVELPHGVPDPIKTWVSEDYTGTVVHPISGVAPESWFVAKNAGLPSYYIDSGSSHATDTQNPFGSPDKPRSTIPEIEYAAGSYIEIHGGPYTGGGQIIFTGNGSPDKPIWFRSPSVDNKAIIAGDTIVKGQYIFMENLRFEDSTPLSLRTHRDSMLSNVVIRNMSFIGDGSSKGNGSAIAMYSNIPAKRFHDFLIYNNEIAYLGDDFDDVDTSLGVTIENDFHGVHPDINLDRVWIFNNKIHHLGGDSVQVGRATIPDEYRPSHIYIAENEFYSNLENGVDVKEADFTLVIANKIYNWRQHKDNGSTGSAIVVHNHAKDTWIINNQISDAANGVVVSQDSLDTWVIGNVIENIKHSTWDESWNGGDSAYSEGAAIHFRGYPTGGAVNNTLINIDTGIQVVSNTGGYVLMNNIITERNEESTYDIHSAISTSANYTSSNLVYHPNLDPHFKYADCISCIYESPSFQSGTDYETTNNSPAVSAGSSIDSILTQFKERFGSVLSLDIQGGDRVVGTIDIGAYENPYSDDEPPILTRPSAPYIESIIINSK